MGKHQRTYDDASKKDRGRIVITLEYVIPKDQRDAWPYPTNHDATNVLREWAKQYGDDDLSLDDLINMSDGMSVDVGK